MALAVAVYAAFGVALVGVIALIHPIPSVGISERWHGVALTVIGLSLSAFALWLPARETQVAVSRTLLDEFVPHYQFSEFHSISVQARPATVYRATQDVTANEIRFFKTLTWIRRFGRKGPESILNAPEAMPLLEVATRTGFLELAREPERELVIGTLVVVPKSDEDRPRTPADFQALVRPGFAKAALNFRIEADGQGGSLVSTETRVFATDASARRRFTAYWRLILPGSALIRKSWLAAIRRRAEDVVP